VYFGGWAKARNCSWPPGCFGCNHGNQLCKRIRPAGPKATMANQVEKPWPAKLSRDSGWQTGNERNAVSLPPPQMIGTYHTMAPIEHTTQFNTFSAPPSLRK
jgi:hypothetical protein